MNTHEYGGAGQHDPRLPAVYNWKKLRSGCFASPCGEYLATRVETEPGAQYQAKGWTLSGGGKTTRRFCYLRDLKATVNREVQGPGIHTSNKKNNS